MGTLFFILAVLFFAGVIYFGRDLFKEEEPKGGVGGSQQPSGGSQQAEEKPLSIVACRFKVLSVLFGTTGICEKGETFFKGKIRPNSMLYFALKMNVSHDVMLEAASDSFKGQKIQIGAMCDDNGLITICQPSNDKRQSLAPHIIHDGDEIWVSSTALADSLLPKYFVIRLYYREDSGNGYSGWIPVDTINLHNA